MKFSNDYRSYTFSNVRVIIISYSHIICIWRPNFKLATPKYSYTEINGRQFVKGIQFGWPQ